MTKPWTVYIWCVEDATEFRSYFLSDLREMTRATKDSALTYHIRYASTQDAFGHYNITVAAGVAQMEAIDPTPNTEQAFRAWITPRTKRGHTAVIFSGHSSGWDVGSHALIPTYQHGKSVACSSSWGSNRTLLHLMVVT